MKYWIMGVWDRVVVWWHRRQFAKRSGGRFSRLVGEPNKPIEIQRFGKGQIKPTKVKMEVAQGEHVAASVFDRVQSGFTMEMTDSKTPGFATRLVFNDQGKLIKEIRVPLERNKS